MRLYDLFGLYGRKFLGHELQRRYLDLPRLRVDQRVLSEWPSRRWTQINADRLLQNRADCRTMAGSPSVSDRFDPCRSVFIRGRALSKPRIIDVPNLRSSVRRLLCFPLEGKRLYFYARLCLAATVSFGFPAEPDQPILLRSWRDTQKSMKD